MTTMICLSVILYLIANVHSVKISPTISNSTGDFYIISESTSLNFQFDSITCASSTCYIVCDVMSGCYSTNIAASSLTETLIIQCIEENSCSQATIIGSSITTTIYCSNQNSCKETSIQTFNGITDLYCNNVAISTSYSESTCYQTYLIGNNNNDINIYCNIYDCYQSEFYGNSANTMNIQLQQQYSASEINIYGSDIINALNINSQSDLAISTSNIYCPSDGNCNINCIDSLSCYDINIFIPNHEYNGFSLNC
eukprot:535788_1